MKSPIWHLSLGPVWGGLTKETMASPSIAVWEKVAPQALVWSQTIESLFICPQCLSSCCPHAVSQMEWVPVSLCTGLLRGTPWDSSSLSLPQLQFPLVLQPGVMGLLFMAPKPWAGGPAVGLGPFTPKGSPPQWKYYSWFLFITHGCGTSLFLAFVSPTHQCGFHSFWLQVVLNDAFYSLVLILIWLSTHDLDTANLCFYSLDA